MKKIFLVGLAAAAMLTGCSNDDTVEIAPSKAIDFSNAFVNNATRASDPSLTTGKIENFVVYGFAGEGKIFNGQEVEKNAEGKWAYSPVQYWVPGYKYTFGAIAPKGQNVSDVKLDGDKVGMTVSFTNDGTTDLLHAAPAAINCDDNFVTDPKPVALTFNHQLSKVKFTIKGAMDGYNVIVSDVKITDAYQTGTLTIAATGNTWKQQDNKNLELNFAQGDEEKLMIPMGSTAEYNVKFHVELQKDGVSLSQYDHETKIQNVAFEAGYCYNFTANLTNENIDPDQKLNPIEFTVEKVTDWTEKTPAELPLQ